MDNQRTGIISALEVLDSLKESMKLSLNNDANGAGGNLVNDRQSVIVHHNNSLQKEVENNNNQKQNYNNPFEVYNTHIVNNSISSSNKAATEATSNQLYVPYKNSNLNASNGNSIQNNNNNKNTYPQFEDKFEKIDLQEKERVSLPVKDASINNYVNPGQVQNPPNMKNLIPPSLTHKSNSNKEREICYNEYNQQHQNTNSNNNNFERPLGNSDHLLKNNIELEKKFKLNKVKVSSMKSPTDKVKKQNSTHLMGESQIYNKVPMGSNTKEISNFHNLNTNSTHSNNINSHHTSNPNTYIKMNSNISNSHNYTSENSNKSGMLKKSIKINDSGQINNTVDEVFNNTVGTTGSLNVLQPGVQKKSSDKKFPNLGNNYVSNNNNQIITTNYLKDFIHSESINNKNYGSNYNKLNEKADRSSIGLAGVKITTPLNTKLIDNASKPLSTKSSTAKKITFTSNASDKTGGINSNSSSTNVINNANVNIIINNNNNLLLNPIMNMNLNNTNNSKIKKETTSANQKTTNEKLKNILSKKL